MPTIQNEFYQVMVSEDGLSLRSLVSGHAFVTNGKLSGEAVQSEAGTLESEAFGTGSSLRLDYADGSGDTILLFPKLPFVLFRSRAVNRSDDVRLLSTVKTFEASVSLGVSPELARSFGTAGVDQVEGYGSYSYMAVVDPATRSGVVSGWLTHERGDGIVLSERSDEGIKLSAQIDYGRLQLEGGAEEELELFAVGWFDDARLGLEAYAEAIRNYHQIQLPPIPTVYCTWYDCGRAGKEEYIFPLTDFVEHNLKPFGHSVIQLDDGWQLGTRRNGPHKVFHGYDPNGPYPHGMTRTADYVKAKGLTAGLWLMPFAADEEEAFYQEHMDWLVKNPDGQPMVSRWGGATLDMSYGPAKDYVADVIRRIVKEWGYSYLKMDGLYTGIAVDLTYINNKYKPDNLGVPEFADKSKTPLQIYRDGLRLVRENAGDDVFLLGCCVRQNMRSFGGSFGLVDGMRIGPDNSANLDRILRGPVYGGQTYFLHGRVWYNDPDPIYVREAVPYAIARSLASWQGLSGQLHTSSDNYPGLPPERLELLKRTMPNHGRKPRPLDLFETSNPRVWCLTGDEAGGAAAGKVVVGLFNWDFKAPFLFQHKVSELGLQEEAVHVGVDFWSGRFVGPVQGSLAMELPPGDCRIVALRPIVDYPQVLGTSRHISQGLLELREEAWDAAGCTLGGISQMVGGDSYELRIASMAAGGVWVAVSAEAELLAGDVKEDQASMAGTNSSAAEVRRVRIELIEQEGGALRVRLDSPMSGDVRWSVRFQLKQDADPWAGFASLQSLETSTSAEGTARSTSGEQIEEPTDF